MRSLMVLALCGALAACSQTASTDDGTPTAAVPASARTAQGKAAAKPSGCDAAIRKQANSAVLGSTLGMVGGFGGLGGRGGMVAAQVASTAGGVIARAQAAEAQSAVMRECSRTVS